MANLSLSIKILPRLNNFLLSRSISTEALKKEWIISIGKTDDGNEYTIKLNDVNLKTPCKNLIRIKDETLALGVANEWRSKAKSKKLDLPTMHLTTLTYEAIDNPFNETKKCLIDSIVDYLSFDTIRFRDVENESLFKKQSRHWDPMVGWFEHKFNCHLPIEYGYITNTGSLPKNTIEVVSRYLNSHERWPLVGIKFLARNLKSYVLSSSLTEKFLDVEQAVELSRLETKFQTERWSKVEWEHDLDEQCTNARVSAGTLFYHLSV